MKRKDLKRDTRNSTPRRRIYPLPVLLLVFLQFSTTSSLNGVTDCPTGSTSINGECRWNGDIDGRHSEESRHYDDDFDDNDDDEDGTESVGGVEVNCNDEHDSCEMWASVGECNNNPNYMLRSCRKSCNSCDGAMPATGSQSTETETEDPHEVDPSDPSTLYGLPQQCDSSACHEIVSSTSTYMTTETATATADSDPNYLEILTNCKNQNADCALWASTGECDANPSYMTINCAPSCKTCRHLDYDFRCPRDPDAEDALRPGDLHRLFERIVHGPNAHRWNTTVLSRPAHPVDDPNPAAFSYEVGGPWVVTVDGFVSPASCARLVELGAKRGYERSTDVGAMKFDGTSEEVTSQSRTSYNAWCKGECFEDEETKRVLVSIEELTGIKDTNSEHLQLLRYKNGQFYKRHHDYIEIDKDRPTGPRILTAYLYLNDVLEGGGTNFPQLKEGGLTVMPQKGRLLLWPSVLNDDPTRKDYRTEHEALTVVRGEKYGANGWIHLRDFKTPHEKGCS